MAESIVNVTEGSGKKLHTFNRTIGANSVEDEVTINGEQYLASYTATVSGQSGATAATHLIQIMAGASLKVRIRWIELSVSRLATTAALSSFSVVRLTTAGTGGGAATPAPLDTTDAASGATAMAVPTAKGTEGATIWAGTRYIMQTAGASAEYTAPLIFIDFDRPRSKPLMIAAGTTNGIALKILTATANLLVDVTVGFDESNF